MSTLWTEVLTRPREIFGKLSRGQRVGVAAFLCVGLVTAGLSSICSGLGNFVVLRCGLDSPSASEIAAQRAAMEITASVLIAERTRLSVIAQNIANAQVTKMPDGQPYRRQKVVFETVTNDVAGGLPAGAVKAHVAVDDAPFRRVKEPGHPDADRDGWVSLPNVDVASEMVDLLDASCAFEASRTALRDYRQMLQQLPEAAR